VKRKLSGSVLILAVVLAVACSASAVKVEYNALAVTVHSVDFAMNAWGEYVRAGLAKPGQEDTVRKAYETYQAAARVSGVALNVSSGNIVTPPELKAAADALVQIVNLFTGKVPVPVPTKGVA
jgi:dihydroorotate dehydrogenase